MYEYAVFDVGPGRDVASAITEITETLNCWRIVSVFHERNSDLVRILLERPISMNAPAEAPTESVKLRDDPPTLVEQIRDMVERADPHDRVAVEVMDTPVDGYSFFSDEPSKKFVLHVGTRTLELN